MANSEHRSTLQTLHGLVAASSDSRKWGESTERMPVWQWGVLTRLHALTLGEDIHYLSSASLDDDEWDFAAFTGDRVVRILVTNVGTDAVRFETTTFPRNSLQSIELLDVDPVPDTDESWPSDINLIGHYRAGSIPLPLDKFASATNKHDLTELLRSLLQDLNLRS